MDTNIIDEYRNMPVAQRTNKDFDSLLRTLEIVWGHKVYQDGLLEEHHSSNRELYDLSMTIAQGLVGQHEGCKITLTKYKDIFKNQSDRLISCSTINTIDVLFTMKQLRQICMYYLDNGGLYFFATMTIINSSSSDEHLFTFGEIVVRVIGGEEVVLVYEDNLSIHYVNAHMLQIEERYIIPKIGIKSAFMSLQSGRRFVVNKDEVVNLYNEYARIFEQLT